MHRILTVIALAMLVALLGCNDKKSSNGKTPLEGQTVTDSSNDDTEDKKGEEESNDEEDDEDDEDKDDEAVDGFCSRTSHLAVKACKLEAEADYLLALGRCKGFADPEEAEECLEEAREEFEESIELCKDQREARRELCEELGEGVYDPEIDPENFVDEIDNPYYPLIPGTTYIYEAMTEEGLERIQVAVIYEKREILGVECTVVRDTVTLDGETIEDTFDWFAQDIEGNVWYFGELSFELEDGEIVNLEGSWEAGEDGAKPGIVMKANPMVGDLCRQEYLLGEAEDMGRVLSLDETVTVPYGVFTGCRQTADFTPLEPDGLEYKYYAPGLGLVLEVDPETDTRAELVEVFGLEEPAEFNDVTIRVVFNSTVDNAQVEIVVDAGEPLELFQVIGPEDEKILELTNQNTDDLGQSEVIIETIEASLEEIKESYPEGEYRFVGWTVEGQILIGEAELFHELLEAPEITYPQEGDIGVPIEDLTATWLSVNGAEGYFIELEDEEIVQTIRAKVPADGTSFTFPVERLRPGTEYTLDVKAFGENGNRTVTDLQFITAE